MDRETYENLLANPPPGKTKKELHVQRFLEENSSLIPTPALLNHHLHHKCVISQFPLDTTLIPDFVYITKSSILWRIVLVELESPDKQIFKTSKKQVGFRSEFNEAFEQIRSWKVFVQDNRDAILKRLRPFWRPEHMRSNPVEFSYALVYGRSSEYENRPRRAQSLAQLQKDESVHFFSYDSLFRASDNGWNYKKNVMCFNKDVFSFKYLHCEPGNLFCFVSPDDLKLAPEHKMKLLSWGYQIDEWENGQMLKIDGKRTWDKEAGTF